MHSERKRISLSYFESVLHKSRKHVTLTSEIKDCFEYFDLHTPKVLVDNKLILIHANGIELKKVKEGKGYAIEFNGETKVVGIDNISKAEQMEMVKKIRNITFPYALHASQKYKKP